jgi:hypothetical protein
MTKEERERVIRKVQRSWHDRGVTIYARDGEVILEAFADLEAAEQRAEVSHEAAQQNLRVGVQLTAELEAAKKAAVEMEGRWRHAEKQVKHELITNSAVAQAASEWQQRAEAAEAARDKLQRFKNLVHARLDAMGVPHHPPGVHGAEGCRVGDRMDWLEERLQPFNAASCPKHNRPIVHLPSHQAHHCPECLADERMEAIARAEAAEMGAARLRNLCLTLEVARDERDAYLRDLEQIGREIGCGHLEDGLSRCVADVVERVERLEAALRAFLGRYQNKMVNAELLFSDVAKQAREALGEGK